MSLRSVLRSAAARTGEIIRRRRVARELEEELQFHLDCEIAHRVARGASPADARRDALIAFGGVQRFREETRDARGFAALEAFARDLRFALRRLGRAPAFTLGTIATLGIGIGIAAAVGALVYGVMLRPLSYPDSPRLVRVSLFTPGLGIPTTDHSGGTFTFLADRARAYAALGAYHENRAVSITEGEVPERVSAAALTPNVMDILGVSPAAGRLLTESDAAQGFTTPVLISFDLWQRRYGGDPSIVGRYIEINRARRLIAGVLPRGFGFPSPETAIYYPVHPDAERASLDYRNLAVIGRLTNGTSVELAQREMNALLPRLGERFPEVAGEPLQRANISGRVETLRDATVAPVRSELSLLAALVVVVMLIVLANVTTLALLRAERLRVEVAVARALGASSGAVRQRFVAETLLLALAGGAMAVLVAALALATRFGLTDADVPRLHELGMTPTLAAAIPATTVSIGVMLGLVMSAHAARGASEALRANVRATPGRGWRRAQESLVAVQIALAAALLVNAALFTASMVRLGRVDLGFVAAHGAQFALQIPFRGYETYQRTAAFDLTVVDGLRRAPGVTDAAAAMELPSTPQLLDLRPTLRATRDDGRVMDALVRLNVVSPGFFRVMGIPLRDGRTFEPGDLAAANPGVVLSAALARDLFGEENPVGHMVRFTTGRYPAYRIVGVAGDVFSDRVTDGALRTVYYPLLNDLGPTSTETEDRFPVMPGGMHFVVRSPLPLETLVPAFRATVRSVDARVPIWDVRTLEGVVAATTARLRLSMLLLSAAALATLFLGAIGIYSVVAYTMSGRTPELAVRLALGASPRRLMRLVYRESAWMTGIGIATGGFLSLATARLVRGLLYEVSPTDPRVLAASIAAVVLVAAVAIFSPARRTARIDPAAVLRG